MYLPVDLKKNLISEKIQISCEKLISNTLRYLREHSREIIVIFCWKNERAKPAYHYHFRKKITSAVLRHVAYKQGEKSEQDKITKKRSCWQFVD